MVKKGFDKEIDLSSLIKPKYIVLSLKQNKKTGIIKELADLANKYIRLKNNKVLLNAILERERLGSTALGNGIAIPHAKIKNLKKPLLILGRAEEGVDFDSLDGEKTYLFFLLISPQDKVGLHLKILAKISHLIKDKFIIELLKKAKDKNEILKIISNFKNQ